MRTKLTMKIFGSTIFKIALAFMLVVLMISCANTKRDCQGNKKFRQPNGVWL